MQETSAFEGQEKLAPFSASDEPNIPSTPQVGVCGSLPATTSDPGLSQRTRTPPRTTNQEEICTDTAISTKQVKLQLMRVADVPRSARGEYDKLSKADKKTTFLCETAPQHDISMAYNKFLGTANPPKGTPGS